MGHQMAGSSDTKTFDGSSLRTQGPIRRGFAFGHWGRGLSSTFESWGYESLRAQGRPAERLRPLQNTYLKPYAMALRGMSVLAVTLVGTAAPAADLAKVSIAGPAPVLSATDSIIWYAVPTKLGYFKDEGLDVSYNLSAGLTASAQIVQAGSAEFAVTNPEVVMKGREQGGSLIAFQTLRPTGGNAVAVLPDSPIKSLTDLKGKTLGAVSWGGGGGQFLTRMLAGMGIGMDDYVRVTTSNGAAAAAVLRSGQVDAVVLWDSAYAGIENNGVKMRFIAIPDQEKVGGNVFVTTEAFLKKNEDVVAGFCRAVTKAVYFARVNPKAAVDIFLEVNPTMRVANIPAAKIEGDSLHIFSAYLNGATLGLPMDAPYGKIDPAVWASNQKFYVDAGMLEGKFPPDRSFTTKLTDHCNDFDHAKVEAAAKGYKEK
jgi:NitT/TauT family transport system substrate-binding protein